MGLFFRKRLGLGPLTLNLSKSGLGLSLGVRGFHAGITATGRHYVSANLPGTGLYYRKFQQPFSEKRAPAPMVLPTTHPVHRVGYVAGYFTGWALIVSPIVLAAWLALRLIL
jgi:hypothetical protein